ncbi:hypothetical protein GWA97_09375 [Flavobacterium sp. LaA7.5]|nr:hypothetical protein [Flavobacterium salilacus subsp. altitudinum]
MTDNKFYTKIISRLDHDEDEPKDYPSFFSNDRTEVLNTALESLMELIDEYAAKNNMSENEIIKIKKIIIENYLERKASLYIKNKVSNFNDYLSKSLDYAINRGLKSNNIEEQTKIFYYKNKHHIISNEQY